MEPYQTEFGKDYVLGISIPDYFEDQSYRNDTGPSFVYRNKDKLLKICILPEERSLRDIDNGCRYTLMEMTNFCDDYQEFVEVRFETESPDEFKKVIFDKSLLDKWLDKN